MRNRRATDAPATADAPLIDFLPPRVHKQTQDRGDRPIRRIAAATVLMLLFVGYVAHARKTARLIERRDQLVSQQASSLEPTLATSLQREHDELENQANLLATFLPHTSTSRLLATVSEALPASGHLQSMRMSRELSQRVDKPVTKPKHDEADWKVDLDERLLRQRTEHIELIVRGMVPGDAELGRFIESLGATGCFASIDVNLAESATLRGLPRRRFEIELRLHGGETIAHDATETLR